MSSRQPPVRRRSSGGAPDKCLIALNRNNFNMRLMLKPLGNRHSELPDLLAPGSPRLISANSLSDLERGKPPGFPQDGLYQQLIKSFAKHATKLQENLIDQQTNSGGILRDSRHELIANEDTKGGDDNEEETSLPKSKIWWCESINPEGRGYMAWLMAVSAAFVYNCWVIPLRSTFCRHSGGGAWLAADCLADAVYLLDAALVQPRLMYMRDGFWVGDPELTARRCVARLQFKMDVLSLLPTDLLYLKYGADMVVFRLPRMLKVHAFWEMFDRMAAALRQSSVVRLSRSVSYVIYVIHLNACGYYLFSVWREDGTSNWVFSGKGTPYLQCFYFAIKTTTAMGRNPKPDTLLETIFMNISWLVGVFMFAILIGQVREQVLESARLRTEYRKVVDGTLEYMRRLSVASKLQDRVKLWLNFTMEQQHSLDESAILNMISSKLQMDIAINVHINTLTKMQIFKDCDAALLRDLVPQLKRVLFLPGDYVCRKGEVGKEMYIVKTGVLQVMEGEEVIATLSEGSVFGEISLLALGCGNRRTADVRSLGFSNLFILNKHDFNETIANYPDAQELLQKRAEALVRENAERERNHKSASTEPLKAESLVRRKERAELNHRPSFQCPVTVHRAMS
ncbi:cyclic nucleotide-gated cation channel beta-1-like isoform X2 [Bacillus rossius redtenbacheri]|uniref:cyclic nucleotide-gated cation channel beta-1-like isoform X2 n=1 Tax=Bacillus rossius redtenbacheri TaxID=93214 RepID=UPI002FDD513B